MKQRAGRLALGASILLSSLSSQAEQGDVEVGVEVAGGLPVAGYLGPPGKNDNYVRAGGLGLLNLGVGLNSLFSLEVLGGAGYLGEFSKNNDAPGDWVGQVTAGPKLRVGKEERWWLSAHTGLYHFDGTQFGLDAGTGYDFGGEEWRAGPLVRYQLTFAGKEDPHWPDESRPDAAIWLGFGIRHLHGHQHNSDLDGDGLVGEADRCPQDAEDKDGFQDGDGCPDPDNDFDRLADVEDKCPLDPEDVDGFEDEDGCPDPDNDGDGVPDTADSCPLEAEDADGFQDKDGCPDPDNDGDGVLDAADKCGDKKEDVDGFQDEDGCPDLDNDSDGVPDTADECPRAPGTAETKGCPKAVRYDEATKSIAILETIEFQFGSATLKPSAEPILDEVRGVIAANPSIKKVRIEGHSDDQGPDAVNMKLSTERAAAVTAWLTEHEIEASRLEAYGCGEVYPVETAKTAAARAKNRRVEFHVMGDKASERGDCQAAE